MKTLRNKCPSCHSKKLTHKKISRCKLYKAEGLKLERLHHKMRNELLEIKLLAVCGLKLNGFESKLFPTAYSLEERKISLLNELNFGNCMLSHLNCYEFYKHSSRQKHAKMWKAYTYNTDTLFLQICN